jgi:hypothetical protein
MSPFACLSPYDKLGNSQQLNGFPAPPGATQC